MTVAMGKNKQTKEKKINRSVEISAPIVDPELIKKFHSPTRGLDLRHGGFKALLSDPSSQDSTEEVTILDEYHIPSYIGISCAVSGYTSYSSQARRARGGTPNGENSSATLAVNKIKPRPISPVLIKTEPHINHITLDKSQKHSADEERRELTEKLTASANESLRSPSPTIPPTEDDRHHGAYVGARYFPLSSPSNAVIKHIPLLGIDDEASQDKVVEDENKVEQKIASLYGEDFASGWRESMSHKSRKEQDQQDIGSKKTPKDLVKLKPASTSPTPEKGKGKEKSNEKPLGKAKNFLSKMFGGNKSPVPSTDTEKKAKTETTKESGSGRVTPAATIESPAPSPIQETSSPVPEPDKQDNQQGHDTTDEVLIVSEPPRMESVSHPSPQAVVETPENLVSLSPEPSEAQPESIEQTQVDPEEKTTEVEHTSPSPVQTNDGRYYLDLVEQEKASISELVRDAEKTLETKGNQLNEDAIGAIRSAIGKANLLMQKKCKQFEELCDANINSSEGEQFATLNEDLAGFWDMLSIQFNEVRKAFGGLDEPSKEPENDSSNNNNNKDKASRAGNKPKLSAQKDQERREKLQEHINQMKQAKSAATDEILAGFEDSAGTLTEDAAAIITDTSDELVQISERPGSLIEAALDTQNEPTDTVQSSENNGKADCPTGNLIDA